MGNNLLHVFWNICINVLRKRIYWDLFQVYNCVNALFNLHHQLLLLVELRKEEHNIPLSCFGVNNIGGCLHTSGGEADWVISVANVYYDKLYILNTYVNVILKMSEYKISSGSWGLIHGGLHQRAVSTNIHNEIHIHTYIYINPHLFC